MTRPRGLPFRQRRPRSDSDTQLRSPSSASATIPASAPPRAPAKPDGPTARDCNHTTARLLDRMVARPARGPVGVSSPSPSRMNRVPREPREPSYESVWNGRDELVHRPYGLPEPKEYCPRCWGELKAGKCEHCDQSPTIQQRRQEARRDRDVPSLPSAKGRAGAHDLRQVPRSEAGLERPASRTVRA